MRAAAARSLALVMSVRSVSLHGPALLTTYDWLQRADDAGPSTVAAEPAQQQPPAAEHSLRSFQQNEARPDPVAGRQPATMSTSMLKLIAGTDQ